MPSRRTASPKRVRSLAPLPPSPPPPPSPPLLRSQALVRELENQVAVAYGRSGEWTGMANPASELGALLGQYYKSTTETPHYFITMANFALAAMKNKLTEWFLAKSSSAAAGGAGGEDTYEWDGPWPRNCKTYSGCEKVKDMLAQVGEKLGESNAAGQWTKENYLGFQMMNGTPWPEVEPHRIGLGAPTEVHAWIRPILSKWIGPKGNWSVAMLAREARKFFHGRTDLEINKDCKIWVSQVN